MFHAPHYVLPPLVRCKSVGHHSRLHPLDVSAIPAESHRAGYARVNRLAAKRATRV
jgi:hypothetical protein